MNKLEMKEEILGYFLLEGVDIGYLLNGLDEEQIIDTYYEISENNVDYQDVLSGINKSYTSYQLEEIEKGLKSGIDTSLYSSRHYASEQMREIRLGLEVGVDTSIYANLDYDSFQMNKIREGLEKGLDVSTYANFDFEYDQMNEIMLGLEAGIDVSIYNSTTDMFNITQMKSIRKGLEFGINAELYADSSIPGPMMEQYKEFLLKNKDIDLSADLKFYLMEAFSQERSVKQIECLLVPGLDSEQLCFLYEFIEDEDMSLQSDNEEKDLLFLHKLADPKYPADEMEMLIIDYSEGVDCDLLMSVENPYHRNNVYRLLTDDPNLAFKSHIDPYVFASTNYSPEQMEQIVDGLEIGVDVSVYANPDLTTEEMETFKNELIKLQEQEQEIER